MTPGQAAAQAAAAYNGLLEDAALAGATAAMLRQRQAERGLSFGPRPLSVALRPALIARRQYDAVTGAAAAVGEALLTLETALLQDPELRRELALDPEEERLALADTGYGVSSPSARLDGFLGPSGDIRFVECNAESPAGMAYADALAAVFDELPVMRTFEAAHRLTRLPVAQRQVDALLGALARARPGETASVAIVDWEGLPTRPEFEMFQAMLHRAGVAAVICAPEELAYAGGRLHAGGTPVNLVYRRVLAAELEERGPAGRDLQRAYLDGAVCVVNSFRAKLLHKKMSLALLSDPRYERLYDAGQRAAIARHIPWTRRVTRALQDEILARRAELVLKPNDDYGGRGVVLGWTVDDAAWERQVEAALDSPWVVQERVEIPREEFPVDTGSGVVRMRLAVDVNPYLFDSAPSGCLSRLSSSALLNVTSGAGSVVPTYVVEDR